MILFFKYLFLFLFGACLGSFLNALVYRIPRKIDFIFKRSACPQCNKKIYFYENIPIFSWMILKGKCSSCAYKIPFRYLFIEFFMGFSLMALFFQMNIFDFFFYTTVLSFFVLIFFIDLEFQIIPNMINLCLFILLAITSYYKNGFEFVLKGSLLGLLAPLCVTYIYYKFRGVIGLGGGDIKLWGALGAYLGWMGFLHNLYLSCFLGSLIMGTAYIVFKIPKDRPFSFGPFIVAVAIFQIFFDSHYRSFISILF